MASARHSFIRNLYQVGLLTVAALGAALFEQNFRTASNIYTQIIVFAIGFAVVRGVMRWTLKG